jgi:hypothetical protein
LTNDIDTFPSGIFEMSNQAAHSFSFRTIARLPPSKAIRKGRRRKVARTLPAHGCASQKSLSHGIARSEEFLHAKHKRKVSVIKIGKNTKQS